ncbi:MAG TPA: DUF1822 family protein [Coleofasciculaceae cyanobacterium]|jgi:hypothetical protein
MTHHTNKVEDFALPLPITQMARHTAQRFASTQPTPQKAEQVRLNTLAVCVVNDYLQMMGIPTEISVSDSWNPVVQLCADIADLEVTGVGRLECRPVRKHQPTCYVPPEVWSDRIGYVVVEIDESSAEASMLGFTRTADTEELALNQLRPAEDLIDHLNPVNPTGQPVATVSAAVVQRTRVNLSQWLTNVFDTGWQAIETLLNPAEPDLAFSFRSIDNAVLVDSQLPEVGVGRGRLIDFGTQLADSPVALVVEVIPQSEQRKDIVLQVHPTGNQAYLPPLLELTVLDESGLVFLEAQARSADNYIQLQFSGLSGEQFSVKVALGEVSVMEDFVV